MIDSTLWFVFQVSEERNSCTLQDSNIDRINCIPIGSKDENVTM